MAFCFFVLYLSNYIVDYDLNNIKITHITDILTIPIVTVFKELFILTRKCCLIIIFNSFIEI